MFFLLENLHFYHLHLNLDFDRENSINTSILSNKYHDFEDSSLIQVYR